MIEPYSPKKGMTLFFKGSKTAIYKPILLKALVQVTFNNLKIKTKHKIKDITVQFLSLIWIYRRKFYLNLISGGDSALDGIIDRISKNEWRTKEIPDEIVEETWRILSRHVFYLLRRDTHFYFFLDKDKNIIDVPWDCNSEAIFTKYKNDISYVQIRDDVAIFWNNNLDLIKRGIDFEIATQLEKFNDAPHICEKISLKKPRKKLKPVEWEFLIKYQNSKCFYCEASFNPNEEKEVHEDHVIPWSFIFETKIENIVLACLKCNLKKSDILPTETYLQKLINRNEDKTFLNGLWNAYKDNTNKIKKEQEWFITYFNKINKNLEMHYYRCKDTFKSGWTPLNENLFR